MSWPFFRLLILFYNMRTLLPSDIRCDNPMAAVWFWLWKKKSWTAGYRTTLSEQFSILYADSVDTRSRPQCGGERSDSIKVCSKLSQASENFITFLRLFCRHTGITYRKHNFPINYKQLKGQQKITHSLKQAQEDESDNLHIRKFHRH